jgi:uncharacterized protein YndB with AHSA1/START domain
MPFAYTISAVIPASPKAVYDAWLDSAAHARMTGTHTAKGSTKVGDRHEAWDGYISGTNLLLSSGKRIVQSWRTTEFTDADADSKIDLKFVKAPRGTKLTLFHSNVPEGHEGYKSGWTKFYFEPMKAYFAALPKAKPAAKKKPATKAKAKTAKPKAKAEKKPARKAAPKKSARKPAKKAKR